MERMIEAIMFPILGFYRKLDWSRPETRETLKQLRDALEMAVRDVEFQITQIK